MLRTARLIRKSCSITGLPLTCFHSFFGSSRCSDLAKGAAAQLVGGDVPKHEDSEKTFADLKARLAKTLTLVQSFKPSDIDGSEDREINLTLGEHKMSFRGQPYLVHFVMPNFYFHCTTAYDILRHCGVELGKRDFIGTI